jgi:hypothetical protein
MLPSVEREPRPELSMLNSRLDALEAAMLPVSTDDCFSMLPTEMEFSAPVQPYDSPLDSFDVSPDYMLGISHDLAYNCYNSSFTAENRIPDLPLPPSLSVQDPRVQDPPQAVYSTNSPCALPYEQLFQELGTSHPHTLSQQQEGIKTALQLMSHLCFPNPTSSHTRLSAQEREHWATTLVDKCREVTSAVSDMLQAHSTGDDYFLVVICLVMSKVLDAYVSASLALSGRVEDSQHQHQHQGFSISSSSSSSSSLSSLSSTTTSSSSPRTTASSPVTQEGDPKTVQLLLSSLYQVRTSMDLLGAKIALMPSAMRDCGVFGAGSGEVGSQCGVFGGEVGNQYYDVPSAGSPFSADILQRLYDEQRRRLKGVSLQLVGNLRAFWGEDGGF